MQSSATLVLFLALTLPSCSGGGGGLPAFRVDSTSPTTIQASDTDVPWTLTGAGFQSGATVTTGYAGVSLADVTVVSETQITFHLTASAGLDSGEAQFTVTNPDSGTTAATVPAVAAVVSQSTTVQPIFSANCAIVGCHTGALPPEGLDLSAGAMRGATIGVASVQVSTLSRIHAGDPDISYLVDKIEGSQSVGGRMPLNRPALTPLQIALIRKWIAIGAPDN